MSFAETKINDLFQRLQEQRENATSSQMSGGSSNLSRSQNMTPRPRDRKFIYGEVIFLYVIYLFNASSEIVS